MSHLADWIRELAGEYVESWVADMIAEEWMIDRDRIRELESINAGLSDALAYARRFLKREDVDMDYIDAALAKARGGK
ncbi:MAG: hypothetical protein ACRC16_22005 [Aeromonas salmonicida]